MKYTRKTVLNDIQDTEKKNDAENLCLYVSLKLNTSYANLI